MSPTKQEHALRNIGVDHSCHRGSKLRQPDSGLTQVSVEEFFKKEGAPTLTDALISWSPVNTENCSTPLSCADGWSHRGERASSLILSQTWVRTPHTRMGDPGTSGEIPKRGAVMNPQPPKVASSDREASEDLGHRLQISRVTDARTRSHQIL